MNKEILLTAKKIHKTYFNGRISFPALKDIDIDICKGEFIICHGPSGSGKSTLLHILGGLDKPTGGKICYGNKDVYQLSDNKRSIWRNLKIGFVFQFYHLLGEINVIENIILPGRMRKVSKKKLYDKAQSLLHKMNLQDKMLNMPSQLSGGERQRVAIGRALINEPDVLICDEPTGNLDSVSGKAVIDLLKTYQKEFQKTVIIATHDKDFFDDSARFIYLKDGQIIS